MAEKGDVDRLIREAFAAEGVEGLEGLSEPGLPDLVTDVFRGRMRWYGAMFLAMILGCTVVAILCAIRFFGTDDVPTMLRWAAGFFFCVLAIQGGKSWYWMQLERLAMTRELKRVELMVAHLSAQIRARA